MMFDRAMQTGLAGRRVLTLLRRLYTAPNGG